MIISFKVRLKIYMRDGFCCRYCGRAMNPLSDDLTLDHINPEGATTEENLATCCCLCNSRKGKRSIDDFRALLAHEAQQKITERYPATREFDSLIERVSKLMKVPKERITGRGNAPRLVAARCEVARIARENGMSFPEIGRLLNRHHTTVMHMLARFSTEPAKNLAERSTDFSATATATSSISKDSHSSTAEETTP